MISFLCVDSATSFTLRVARVELGKYVNRNFEVGQRETFWPDPLRAPGRALLQPDRRLPQLVGTAINPCSTNPGELYCPAIIPESFIAKLHVNCASGPVKLTTVAAPPGGSR